MYGLEKVVDMYPGCKLIQIVRDPRDVTTSVLQFPWGPNNAVVAASDWNRMVVGACPAARPPNSAQIVTWNSRYEDLLTHPGTQR